MKTNKIRPLSVEDGSAISLSTSKKGISAHLALINFLKGMIGPGCFSLPLAFKMAGLWAGFILVFLLGFFTSLCMQKLVQSAQYFKKRYNAEQLDYGMLAEISFERGYIVVLRRWAPWARYIVNFCLIVLQLGVCSVFFIFVTDHVKEIVEHIDPTVIFEKRTYFLFAILPFLLLSWVRSIYIMSFISLAGNVLMITSIVIIFSQLFLLTNNWQSLPAVTSVRNIAGSAGAIIYSFEGQAMVLPLENRMKHPQEMLGYTGVISTGIALVTIIYASSGFYGYIAYGDNTLGTITLNLPDTTLNLVVKILLILVIFTGFLMQLYPVIDALTPWLKTKVENKPRWIQIGIDIIIRSILLLIAVGTAFLLPNLEEMIPLVGVSAGMFLALVFPPIIYLNTFFASVVKEQNKLVTARILIVNMFFIILGISFSIYGLEVNIDNIVRGQ